MATKNLTATKSNWMLGYNPDGVAQAHYGAGQDAHLIVGTGAFSPGYNYDWMAEVQFPFDSAYWSDVVSITSAMLQLTTATSCGNASGLSPGASPQVNVRRNTGPWSANSAGDGDNTNTAPTVHRTSGTTTTGQNTEPTPTGDNQVTTVDVTTIVRAMAPVTVAGGGGTANYGIRLRGVAGTTHAAIFRSVHDSTPSKRPILILTYSTTPAVPAPTPSSPVGDNADPTTFRLSWLGFGNPVTSYDIQVTTSPTFAAITHWNASGLTESLPTSAIHATYAGTPLTPGTAYYWRARVTTADGTSGWSTSLAFAPSLDAIPPDVWTRWANTILTSLKDGVSSSVIGTAVPLDDQVADLTGADYRARLHMVDDNHGDPIDRYVELVGMAASVTADGWTIDAVTEDLEG